MTKLRLEIVLAVSILAATGCATRSPVDPLIARVDAVLRAAPLIDGHNDLLIHYVAPDGKSFMPADSYDLGSRTIGQVDLPRMKAGRVGGAIFTTAALDPNDREGSIRVAMSAVRMLAARHPEALDVVAGSAELIEAAAAGRIAMLPGIEGGDQLGESLGTLEAAHRHGIRAITLTWEKTNALGDSSADAPRHGGLSNFGRSVIERMNQLGMLIDLSHAADATVRDALAVSRAPVIFSHSSARALCAAPRNLPDDLLRAVASNGGVVMVTFVPYFTTHEAWEWYERGESEWARLEQLHAGDRTAMQRAMKEWDASNPPPPVTVSDVADQVEHVRRIAGIDHVGLGSDFDGMGSFRIEALPDAASFPILFHELARRGWTDAEMQKLAGRNFLRVLRTIERVAAATE